MTRNTIRRIEVATPILDSEIKERILNYFRIQMTDNVKARVQQDDGSYIKEDISNSALNSQEYFYNQAYASAQINIAKTPQPVKKKKRGFFAWFFGRRNKIN